MILLLRLLTWSVPLLWALLFCSCNTSFQSDSAGVPAIRAILKSAGNGTIKARVYVEGSDGNAVSGAVVTMQDATNQILSLDYDSTTCSYNGILSEQSGESSYTVEPECD
jgi:NADPH-dependent ferric siderophore reductase